MNKRNSNGQFKYKLFKTSDFRPLYLMIGIGIIGASLWVYGEVNIIKSMKPISPMGTMIVKAKEETVEINTESRKYQVDDMSQYISEAVQEFLPTHKSESLMIMHCLAHRENGHAANRNCGDSGKACGPFQFHQDTWNRMRKQMIKAGFATEIGDRYDKKESARTTAWAINNGDALEWGPIMRDAKGSDFAACQAPSWRSK